MTGFGRSIYEPACLMYSIALVMVRSEEDIEALRVHLLKPESPFTSWRRVETPKSEKRGFIGPPTLFGLLEPV